MRSQGLAKHIVGALALAAAIYAGGFWFDQHLRTRRGPWQVTFAAQASGDASLVISQPKLGIAEVTIVFAGERTGHPAATVRFDTPQKAPPIGRVKFEDLTYLPGTVTLELFGHEIELLPRTLYINRKARPWKSGEVISLTAADKPASLPDPKPKKRY